jgi:site-specific DNA recombinase
MQSNGISEKNAENPTSSEAEPERKHEAGSLPVSGRVSLFQAQGRGDHPGRLSHGAKVKRGQLNAVQQGRYGTGPAPYGYRRGNDSEKPLVVDDREAEVVRTIFREYLRTRSTGKVVNYLHTKGLFTRKGNKWSRQAISIILSNRTYRGRVSYGDVETQGLHEPIIEPALFYKANALRDRKRRNRKASTGD